MVIWKRGTHIYLLDFSGEPKLVPCWAHRLSSRSSNIQLWSHLQQSSGKQQIRYLTWKIKTLHRNNSGSVLKIFLQWKLCKRKDGPSRWLLNVLVTRFSTEELEQTLINIRLRTQFTAACTPVLHDWFCTPGISGRFGWGRNAGWSPVYQTLGGRLSCDVSGHNSTEIDSYARAAYSPMVCSWRDTVIMPNAGLHQKPTEQSSHLFWVLQTFKHMN